MKTSKKRLLSLILAIVMVIGLMPTMAFADGPDYTVVVEVSTETDRDKTNDSNTSGTTVDVFAGDTVTAVVKVKSTEKTSFVAADVTFGYDKTNFKMTSSPLSLWEGDLAMNGSFLALYNQTAQGSSRFYNASPDNAGYTMTAAEGGGYEYVLGTFTFEALPGTDAVMDVPFTVNTKSAYVAELWSAGWSSDAAVAVVAKGLKNDAANIRLKEMTASVTKAQKEGGGNLVYGGPNANLKPVQDGYTAKDNTTGAAINDATIKYALKTKAETEATGFDASTLVYGDTNPTVTNAGDYVVFYQVAKPGYVTVSDKIDVTIDKASITLNWSAADLTKVTDGMKAGDGVTTVETTYYASYDAITQKGSALNAPTAPYTEVGTNAQKSATVTEANGGTLNATGTYTFTATIDDNYTITNPEVTVLIDGGKITGYTLKNTDEGTEEWYDGNAHAAAALEKATGATEGVTVKYSLDGTNWQNEIPTVTEVGKNTVQMKLTKDGYYDVIQSVPFEIKNVDYKVEKSDWVTGYDIVLVYTNDTVPGFKYNGAMMYDLSGLANGYKYNNTEYTYVYGLVVYGDADITKVVPSNIAATAINYGTEDGKQSSQYDVNSSKNTDINDLTAVQGTYNVGAEYMDASTHAVTQMTVVLRADVNRDKKVDTVDCSQIKSNTAY